MALTALLVLTMLAVGVTSHSLTCDSATLGRQGAAIESLKGQLASLLTKMSSLETSSLQQAREVQKVRSEVSQSLDSFQDTLDARTSKVAFTAHMSRTGVNVGGSGPFIFDAVTTNIGDAYNRHTGIFVAPYDGVYVFNFIMLNDGANPTIHAQIVKNGQVLGVGTSDGLGEANKWDDGSALVTTRLSQGDHVYVKRRVGGTRVYGNWFTNFSGFLLSADA